MPRRAPTIEQKTARDAEVASLEKLRATHLPTFAFLDPNLCRDARALQVFALIAAHADAAGLTRVGMARIATLCMCSRQLVGKAVKKLRASGYLKLHSRMPVRNGHAMNCYRVVFDPTLTLKDARSISNAPQHKRHHQAVALTTLPPNGSATHLATLRRITSATRIDTSQVPPPESVTNLELINHSATRLQSAEQAIGLWLTYAWKHGQHQPIADDDDLATAHKLVDLHVTSEQLELAIVQDPEADSLKPLVRHLLP